MSGVAYRMAEEIICTKLITAGYASAFLTSSTIMYFSEILFTSIHVYLYLKHYALTKDVPENIQR